MPQENVQLSRNFHLHEFLSSGTAARMGVSLLDPPPGILNNILRTMAPMAQIARDIVGVRADVVNCWRPLEVNRAIGSRDTSAHIEALAVDLVFKDVPPGVAFDKLAAHPTFMLSVDQLIVERGCVHVGMPCAASFYRPRRELRKEFINPATGKPTYPLIRIWEEQA